MSDATTNVTSDAAKAESNGAGNGLSGAMASAAITEAVGDSAAATPSQETAPPSDVQPQPPSQEAAAPTMEDLLNQLQAQAPQPPRPEAASSTSEGLRLRVKVWTDPTSGKRYLLPTAIPDPMGFLTAYAMTDEDSKTIRLTVAAWNALPFFYFREDGVAPPVAAR